MNDDDPTRTEMDLHVQRIVTKQIDEALNAAKTIFPDAESFQTP